MFEHGWHIDTMSRCKSTNVVPDLSSGKRRQDADRMDPDTVAPKGGPRPHAHPASSVPHR
jgi:hypothetical protein